MSSSSAKQAIINEVQLQAAQQNARTLVNSINTQCFEQCVPKPGTSISSSEQSCHTNCMEKYMKAWDTVSRTYIARLQQEQNQRQMLGGLGGTDLS